MFIESLPSKNVSCLILSAIYKVQCTFFFTGAYMCIMRKEINFILFFFFWLCGLACGILVPWTGIELASPSVEAQSLGHWPTRELYSFACGYPVVPGSSVVKYPPANASRQKRWFNPWVGKIPWRRKWQLTPVFFSRECHGQGISVCTVHRVAKYQTLLHG